MAKSRAQRKAEQRKRRQQQLEQRARKSQAAAQHDTQVPESGDVAEVEAALEAGAAAASAPAPSRADVGRGAEAAGAEAEISRRERRRVDKERAKAARESAERRAPKEPTAPRERGRVMGFFASVIAELRKVQWPDRETLVQASAVTVLFVAVAAAYLGVLDALFSWLVDQLIA
jgi:preprotein translocase subunit SecE